MVETAGWLTFAVAQIIILACGGVLLLGARRDRPYLWMVGTGALLLAVNLAWYASGGLAGPAAALMRGGMQGFWLSSVTFADVIVLGVVAGVRHRRSEGGRQSPHNQSHSSTSSRARSRRY